MINFYEKMPNNLKRENKLDRNFRKHHILPTSMICVIGGTGSGKSNAVANMISHQSGKYYSILVYNPVSVDEPIYNLMKEKMPDIELISDIEQLPALSEFEENKDQEKLIIIDDFINMPKKDFKKINEYFTGGRKAGFTVVALCQNYTSVPKIITRNCQYFLVFKLNDNTTISNIIRNHNIHNVNKDRFRNLYDEATSEPLNFFMVDLKSEDKSKHLRKNFLEFYKI
jgi:hypothetical protein